MEIGEKLETDQEILRGIRDRLKFRYDPEHNKTEVPYYGTRQYLADWLYERLGENALRVDDGRILALYRGNRQDLIKSMKSYLQTLFP